MMKPQWAALAVSTAVLTACGGGGDSTDGTVTTPTPTTTTASATGIWTGTTDTNRSVTGVVLGDGTYYVLYSPVGTPSVIAGLVQGNGTMSGSTFTSSNAKDFNLEDASVMSATLSAIVATKQTFNGTVSDSNGAVTFTSTYDPTSDTAASLDTVHGSYTGQVATSAGLETATVTVNPSGALSGTGVSGCTVSGTVSPRTDVNAYNITVSFGPSPCLFAGETFAGVAAFDGDDKRLYAAAPNASRTDGILFVGTKP